LSGFYFVYTISYNGKHNGSETKRNETETQTQTQPKPKPKESVKAKEQLQFYCYLEMATIALFAQCPPGKMDTAESEDQGRLQQ